MNDLISREDTIREIVNRSATDFMDVEAIATVIHIVNQMPSAQTEQQWISCYERLPNIGEDILFSVADMYTAEGCLRDDGDYCQFRWNSIIPKDRVIAWMPLPRPYDQQESEEV